MGEFAGIYGCVLNEVGLGKLEPLVKYFTFGSGTVFVSDHYKAGNKTKYSKAVQILEDSLLLFDIDESNIKTHEYPLNSALKKNKKECERINLSNFVLIYCNVYISSKYAGGDVNPITPGAPISGITWPKTSVLVCNCESNVAEVFI